MPIFNYYPTATSEEIPDHYNNNNSFYSNYANNSSILASRQQPISYLHSHPIFSHNIWSDSFSTLPTQVGSSSQSVPSLSSRSWSLYNHHSDSEDENEIEPLSSSSLSDYSNALMIQKQQRQQQTSQLQRAQQPVEQQEKQSVKSYQQLQLKQPQQQQQQEVSQSNNRQKEQESDEDDEEHNSKFRHLFHHHRRSPSRFFHRHQNHNTKNSNNNNNNYSSSYNKNSTKMRRVPIDEPIEQQVVSGGQEFSISPKISPSQQQPPITTKNFENVENEKQQKTKSEEQQQQLQNDDSHGILTIDQFLSFTNKKIIHSKADGSCLFRSVSQALVQSQNKHRQVRELAVDWMRTHLDTLIDGAIPFRDSIFLKENQSNVQDYLRDMEVEGEWGDFSCIVALSHCLGVRFKIVVVQGETVTSVLDVSPQNEKQEEKRQEEDEDERQVIWLMFDEPRRHYNLIVNNQ